MPKHLYTIEAGTDLPDPAGLPEGYPFAQDNGDGTHTLHALYGGAWQALGGSGGGGGGGAPVGVGDFAVWQHNNAPRDATSLTLNYAADLVDSKGTSIVPSDDTDPWITNWGSPAPKLAAGLYTCMFTGNEFGIGAAAWRTAFGFFDPTGESIIKNTAFAWSTSDIYGLPNADSSEWNGSGTITMWVPEGTHFDFDGFFLMGASVNVTLIIVKVG